MSLLMYVVLYERMDRADQVIVVCPDLESCYDACMNHMRANGYSAPAGFNEHKLMSDRDFRADYRLYSDGIETPYVVHGKFPYMGHGDEDYHG